MRRPVLTRFEKYIKEMDKEQLQKVVAAVCNDVCIFTHDDKLIICRVDDFSGLKCNICPYEAHNDCTMAMVKDLMSVDMMEVIG